MVVIIAKNRNISTQYEGDYIDKPYKRKLLIFKEIKSG